MESQKELTKLFQKRKESSFLSAENNFILQF